MGLSISGSFVGKPRLLFITALVAIVLPLTMLGGCAWMERLQIKNASGKDIAVTSAHTGRTIRIPNREAAFVPHSSGDLTVTTRDGRTWTYRNLAPRDLEGTQCATKRRYLFFGYQEGYCFRGATTAYVVLKQDGRMYAVPPNLQDTDIEKLEQPKGFPRKPVEVEATEKEGGVPR